jgi:hypothetical protein
MEISSPGTLGDSSQEVSISRTYRYILEAFPRLGRDPTLVEMEKDLHVGRNFIVGILRYLEAKGALRLDPATFRIVDAYPYSAVPTEHRAVLESGGQVYCMCAIDAFYVPFLAESDVAIYSRCFHCQSEIEIRVERQKISVAKPATSVIWDSAASYDCPRTNFFCNEEHLLQWRDSAPGEPGKACSLDAALERGRRAACRIRESFSM